MANGRNLTTPVEQVFGPVTKGTTCRICGRDVNDGRRVYCSDYCSNLASAVMAMLNWRSVRRRIIDRDDETCQHCGYDYEKERLARDHIRDLIDKKAGDRPTGPSALELGEQADYDWDNHREKLTEYRDRREKLKSRYGDPYERDKRLEVDHIVPITDGGHPFDPANLQTLCEACHQEKTAEEASERAGGTPTRPKLEQTLADYVTDGGER